jgi:DeoR family transcriptional regulator of aga operon
VKRVQRVDALLERLSTTGQLTVADLASHLGVSQATIRRDLEELESQQLLRRVHGGAVRPQGSTEVPLPYKGVRRQEDKERIARAALTEIGDASIIGLTGGTTTAAVGRLVGDRAGFTIVTTGLNIASELVNFPRLRVIIAGGEVRTASLEVVGTAAQRTLEQFRVDIAFIGVDGITPDGGCTGFDPLGSLAIQTMIERAARVIVVTDSSKFGRVAPSAICPLNQVDLLITDSRADRSDLDRIRAAGVPTLIA